MTAENGSEGAGTPTTAPKTSPAVAYRKSADATKPATGHDHAASCAALEEAMVSCVGHISSDASRTTLAKAKDALSKLFGAQAKLTAEIDASARAPSEKKELLSRCEKLEQTIEQADDTLREAVEGAALKRRAAGDAAFKEEQFDAAYAAYANALGFAPDDVEALLGKSRSAAKIGKWQAVVTDSRKAAKLDVQSSEAHALLVTGLVESGDPAQAAQALGNAPDDVLDASADLQTLGTEIIPEAAKKAANGLFQQKKYAEALTLYTLAVELTDGQRHVYLSNRSACLQALGRWERAADDARRVVELEPAFAKGHLHLARSLVSLDRKIEACEVLEEGIEDGPEDASSLEKLLAELRTARPPPAPPGQQSRQLRDAATLNYKRGLYKEALALYTKCLALDCDQADAVLANRAACWLMVNETQRAVDDCAKAAETVEAGLLTDLPDSEKQRLLAQRSKVATRRASSLQRLGRIDEAIDVVDAALEHDEALEDRRAQLETVQETARTAQEAYDGQEYSRAKRCFVKLRDDFSITDDPDARVKLADCHVHLKEYADGSREALSALATKRLFGAELVLAHGVRADALLAQGDRARAEQHLAACLQLDPDNSDIKTRLKHLRRSTRDADRLRSEIETLVKKGDFEKAAHTASEGIAVDPADKKLTAAMHVRRAKCHQLLALKVLRSNGDRDQRQDKAMPHWRRVHADSSAALYHSPAPLKTAYFLGAEALQGMDRHNDAVDLLESALNTLPDGKGDRDLVSKFKTAQRLLKKAQRPDLYKLVGPDLDEHSDEKALKKAYKKAAMKWHPDRFSCKGETQQKEAEEQFQKINDAYEFLTDASRKSLWDQGFDREEIEQQLEMQKQQRSHGGNPFGGFGGFRRG